MTWTDKTIPQLDPVPLRYSGVWTRTLLETPTVRDDTSFVRWMQLRRWHADLRVPAPVFASRPVKPVSECTLQELQLLTEQQGFCGVTEVSTATEGEVCTWHRLVDYQPPRPTPDAGWMVFESADCVIETGVHGVYREVWHRLPGSTGRLIALEERAPAAGMPGARLLIAGKYLMRVQPHQATGPDFEISFGEIIADQWHIERSTFPAFEGQVLPCLLPAAVDADGQRLRGLLGADWSVLEWSDGAG